ncbi:MAG: hypothetical protein CMJ48_08235 [Planctomycetaceae bacterium]|nr:hypothetical protein [Planctomycetaceae bacterium]
MAGLAIFVLITSVLDALLTLIHLQNGGTEVNPFMQLAILEGTGVFLAWKTWITGLSVAFLAVHQNFRIAYASLIGVATLYACLLGYHGYLLVS